MNVDGINIYMKAHVTDASDQVGLSFLMVENLDESDQFILVRVFIRNFYFTIDLNDELIRIKDPERKYEKKPLNKI